MDKKHSDFFSAYMTLRSFAHCMPEGFFIKLGGNAIVGKKHDRERFVLFFIDGKWIGGELDSDSWSLFKNLVKSLVMKEAGAQNLKDKETLREIVRKQEDRIVSFITDHLAPYLDTIRRHYHGNEGWAGRLTLASVLNAMKVYKLPFEVYGSGIRMEKLKALWEILRNIDVDIKTYHAKEITKEEGDLEKVLSALKRFGKVIHIHMEPPQRKEEYAPGGRL